jgi:hypothetical protein
MSYIKTCTEFLNEADASKKVDDPHRENPFTIVDNTGKIVSQHKLKETAEKRLKALKDKEPDGGHRIVTDKERTNTR